MVFFKCTTLAFKLPMISINNSLEHNYKSQIITSQLGKIDFHAKYRQLLISEMQEFTVHIEIITSRHINYFCLFSKRFVHSEDCSLTITENMHHSILFLFIHQALTIHSLTGKLFNIQSETSHTTIHQQVVKANRTRQKCYKIYTVKIEDIFCRMLIFIVFLSSHHS